MSHQLLWQSRTLPPAESGVLLDVGPRNARLEYIRFSVRQLAAGERWRDETGAAECCLVLLGGAGHVTWDDGGHAVLGPRATVFDGYPSAVYLPAGHRFEVRAETLVQLADCRTPMWSEAEAGRRTGEPPRPRAIGPEDCGYEIRGGGNATRQIVDILPPAFPADRLLICEVFTPGGNWSSYPPHKHDTDNPPAEVDLEETYYFRMRDPRAYAFQRLYTAEGRVDATHTVRDGDLLVVAEGYHPFVTAHGFDAYYLNVLAGTRRSMAASDDPRYADLRQNWPPPDPRLPLVRPPARARA